jgi:auxin response factor
MSHPQLIDMVQPDSSIVNGTLPELDVDEWMMYSSCQPQVVNPFIPSMNQEVWDQYVKNFNLRDLSAESNNQSEICVNVDASDSVSTTMVDPSTSNTIFDDFCSMKDKGSRWKLVYVDYESDVLLVGDDPWE